MITPATAQIHSQSVWEERTQLTHVLSKSTFEEKKIDANSRRSMEVCSISGKRSTLFDFDLHDSMRDGGPSESRMILVYNAVVCSFK